MNMDVVPKRKFALLHISLPQIFKNQKTAFLYKKPQIFDKPLTVLLQLKFPFSEAALRRCSTKQMLLKISQKHKKTFVPESCFNKVSGLLK